jgi:hypothetical protein
MTATSIRGRCLCGAVGYTVSSPFEYSVYCHCTRCRMATGSAFVASAGVRRDHLRIDQGVDGISVYRRGPDAITHFCKQCGSFLYLLVRNGEYAHVQMGTLIDDPGIRPMSHVHVSSKAAWHAITDDLPQFAELPPRRGSESIQHLA